MCCFNIGSGGGADVVKTDWHKALDDQHTAFAELFGKMYTAGAEQLCKSIDTKDDQGNSKESRIGYSSTNQLQELKKTFAADKLKEVNISEDALVVYAVQKVAICDLSPDGILLPGVTQIITISHGHALVRKCRMKKGNLKS